MKSPTDARKDRLAQALRENLKRRKALERAKRQPSSAAEKGDPPESNRMLPFQKNLSSPAERERSSREGKGTQVAEPERSDKGKPRG